MKKLLILIIFIACSNAKEVNESRRPAYVFKSLINHTVCKRVDTNCLCCRINSGNDLCSYEGYAQIINCQIADDFGFTIMDKYK